MSTLPSYNPASDVLPLDDAELAQLDSQLAALPEALNVEALDGFLTALHLAPQALGSLPGEAWLPVVWGHDETAFASGKQRKRLQLLVLRHARALDAQLRARTWQPLFTVLEQGGQEFTDAEDWCTGFMLGVDLDGEGWTPRFEDPRLTEALAPLMLLGGNEAFTSSSSMTMFEDPAARSRLAGDVVTGVLVLLEGRSEPPA